MMLWVRNKDGMRKYGPFIKFEGQSKPAHIWLAELALGKKLPPKAEVHHVDNDPKNNDPRNLVVCPDHNYHILVHRRTDAYNACGNADWVKCPYCKKYDDPRDNSANMRIRVRPKTGTWQCAHRECEKKHFNQVWERQHGRRRPTRK